MAVNLRKHPRRTLDVRAYVETPTACSVADVSETGAKLMVKDRASIPDEFLLRLRHDFAEVVPCRVARRGTGRN